jgi:hypothetical protein
MRRAAERGHTAKSDLKVCREASRATPHPSTRDQEGEDERDHTQRYGHERHHPIATSDRPRECALERRRRVHSVRFLDPTR